jgi:hypothetical protein
VLDEELELLELLEDELEELLLEDDELELEELLEDELELLLDELDELLLEELDVPPLPVQVGVTKLPSCVPRKPKTFVAVWPGAGNCQLNSLVNWSEVPQVGLSRITFQSLVQQTCSGHATVTVQLLKAVVPVLVTLTSTWKEVPPVEAGVAVQLCAANA